MNQSPALEISSLEHTSREEKKIHILHMVIDLLTEGTKGSQTVPMNETKKPHCSFAHVSMILLEKHKENWVNFLGLNVHPASQ